MRDLTRWLHESDDPMSWADVAITLAAIALPPIVAVSLMGRTGAIAFVAAMPAFLAAKDANWSVAALVTLSMGMAGFLALGSPEMALVVAPLLGAMAGICGLSGYSTPCVRALLTWPIFTSPLLESGNHPFLFLVFLLAMLWALAVVELTGRGGTNTGEERESRPHALVFGALLAVGLFVSVYVGIRFFGTHGFWFPLTFVILCLPPHGALFSRTVKRTLGTIAGTAATLALSWVLPAGWGQALIAAVAITWGFRVRPQNYTLFTTLLTVAVLQVLALVSQVDQLALERLGTMGAAAALTIALGGLGFGLLWLVNRDALDALQQD